MSDVTSDAKITIPGDWKCPRCGFSLHKRAICPDGLFIDASEKREVCPNDGVTLEQVYESPDDQLYAMGPCCHDPECLRCNGTNEKAAGWRYRDDPEGVVHPFSEKGSRG